MTGIFPQRGEILVYIFRKGNKYRKNPNISYFLEKNGNRLIGL